MKKLALALIFVLFVPIFASAQTYTETQHTSGLSMPVSMAFTPDGRIFVAEKSGKLKVVKRDGGLVATPSLTLNVSANSERGLLGVALDPNFSTNRYIYLYYTRESFPVKNRLSRFTVSASNPDLIDINSEKVLIDDIASDAGNHNGGAIHFGKDGKLYVAVGDGGQFASNGQALNTLSGKILRINSDGTIPTDNPFYNVAGAKKEIWAYGFRNPFTFAVDAVSGMIHVNDVGRSTWEEVNMLEKGGNYGWPICEGAKNTGLGFCINNEFKYPIHVYDHTGPGKSITAGVFYKGDYYFGDYVGNFIKKINSANVVSDFVTAKSPIDMDIGPDNNLYYLSLLSGKIFKLTEGTSAVNGQCAVVLNTCSTGTFLDSADTATLSKWSCVGTNGGTTAACSAAISNNRPPVTTITSPVVNAKYNAGQSITVTGTGVDPEDGNLPASAFSWTVVFHHDTHTHPFLGPITGKTTDTFTIPTVGELAHNVWYRIYLTTTDSKGAKTEVYRDIHPNIVDLTFRTDPPRLLVTVDGQPQFTPYTTKSVVGTIRNIDVNDQQVDNDTYVFNSWSDNKARNHEFSTPNANTVYTAFLNEVRAASVVFFPSPGSSGDLAVHMQKEIDDRISGVLAGVTTKSMWYTQGSNTAAWDRNLNVITNRGQRALDLSGQSVWNSTEQYKRSGTLVSPRHLIFAKHYPLVKNAVVAFVNVNNEIITRTVEKVEVSTTNDLGVALLDRDVPSSIPFYPVIPRADWEKYLKNIDGNTVLPIFYLNQNDKVGVHVVKASQFYNGAVNMVHAKGEGKRAEFDEPVVGGDSGNPAFAVIGSQPVLLFTHADAPYGPNLGTLFNEVNAMMGRLGGRYQLSTMDLRDFSPARPDTNRAPTASPINIDITDLVTTINFVGSDPDGDPLIFGTGARPARGTLKKETESRYTYTLASLPAASFTDTFNYYSSDKKLTSPATPVTLRYTANSAPVAQNATYTFSGNSTTVTLTASDTQNDALTYTPSTLSTPKGTLALISGSTYTYALKTPLPTASFTETFTFTANDGKSTSNTATITMQYTVTAPQKFTLNVSKTGAGTITGTGINCGTDCTEPINAGSVVSLTAQPTTGYTFTRWTGDCTNTTGACTVTLDRARTVAAVFTLSPSLDADGDGILLPLDKCPNTLPEVRNQVNRAGCVRPKQTKFNTKPIVEDDINVVHNVELGINNVGKIKFDQPMDLTRDNSVIDLDTNVIIEQDRVEIKSAVVPELNKPATITLYNIDEKKPRIMKDGVECTEPQCKVESYIDGVLTFTVSGFSVYTVEETPDTPPTTNPEPEQEKPKSNRGGGRGGGGSSRTTVSQTNEQLIAQLTAQLNLLIAQLNALTGGNTPIVGALTKTLSVGSRDPQVKTLQQLLNKKGIVVPTTGYYGAQTAAAVKKFQISRGISPTGSVGPLTRAQLNK